jgi:hypothetical protein
MSSHDSKVQLSEYEFSCCAYLFAAPIVAPPVSLEVQTMRSILDAMPGRWRRAQLAAGTTAMLAPVLAILLYDQPAHAQYVNMYKTSHTFWDCADLGSATASASRFCRTDNSQLTWFAEQAPPGLVSFIATIMDNTFGIPTDLDTSMESPPVYSGTNETDVIFVFRGDIPSGFAGWTWCDDAITSTKCDQHYVAILDSIYVGWEFICHEVGHAVGLTHGDDADPAVDNLDSRLGCMRTPLSVNGLNLGVININEINATY